MRPDCDTEAFREAMRHTLSGVAVLTTDGAAGRGGVTVSSLSSLSLEPPSVIACVHQDNRTLAQILGNGVFAANVLGAGQERVANCFAGLIAELREDRFAVARWQVLETGAPVLEGALSSFDCELAQVHAFGTHRILIGRVLALSAQAMPPLGFSNRCFHAIAA